MAASIAVFSRQSHELALCARTGRSAHSVSNHGVEILQGITQLIKYLRLSTTPVWLLQAGAWPASSELHWPPPSATGLPAACLGRAQTLSPDGSEADTWSDLLSQSGGELLACVREKQDLPAITSLYIEAQLASWLAEGLEREGSLALALSFVANNYALRCVHSSVFDVWFDRRPRVLQAVTSIQRGGAERVALSLTADLPGCGVATRLITLGRPTRDSFPAPPNAIDLSFLRDREQRQEMIVRIARSWGADLVHCHLVDADDCVRWSAAGLPLVLTAHNMRPGWPEGFERLGEQHAQLLVACSIAVERELEQASIPIPVRTVWNGVDSAQQLSPDQAVAKRQKLRESLGIRADSLVLLSMANPRPQKRLHLLPSILAECEKDTHLLIAGERDRLLPSAHEELRRLEAETDRLELRSRIHFLGTVTDEQVVYAAADVLISTSLYEGLSLAQLEATASGLPVVCTEVGGATELARKSSSVSTVPVDARPSEYAAEVRRRQSSTRLPGDFTRHGMACRYAWHYRRVLSNSRSRDRPRELFLITNNLSIGGAQSSARRLLLGLRKRGVPVRAAVLEEQVEYPTPGRRALLDAGIPVLAAPRPGFVPPEDSVSFLLESIDADPPTTIVFWNVMPVCKLLIADAIWGIPVYDVSPGEMSYSSWERYFANPRPGLPYLRAQDYGKRLAGVVVKHSGEVEQARAFLGAPVHLIPNGIAIPERPLRIRSTDGPIIFGTLTRIHPQKRLEELLSALRLAHFRLPRYEMRIAGGEDRECPGYLAKLQAQSHDLPISWLGQRDDVNNFLSELDAFVMIAEPAGCPNASLEAMAAGLPVVATNWGGMSEQVIDGLNGRLVDRGAVAALAEAIIELARDERSRLQMGQAAVSIARERFSLDNMIDRYCAVFGLG